MNVGSLFSGIGGFDLGLERAGFRTSWFCETDAFCQHVLAEHWPGVPIYPDVSALVGADVEPVDVLCGGFPCQDLSVAGKGAGLTGARSGLWSEYARLIGELRPRYVVVENVSALLARGFGTVLGDLAALGYDAEWDCIPASAVGAPHRRDRVWLVAYPDDAGRGERWRPVAVPPQLAAAERGGEDVADADRAGFQLVSEGEAGSGFGGAGRAADSTARGSDLPGWPASEWWAVEPDVGRVAHGIPARVDRLRSLGNALVPQIAEWIGNRIMTLEERDV